MEAVEQRVRLVSQKGEAGAEEQAENEPRNESSARIGHWIPFHLESREDACQPFWKCASLF
jgi:hypothetical protein